MSKRAKPGTGVRIFAAVAAVLVVATASTAGVEGAPAWMEALNPTSLALSVCGLLGLHLLSERSRRRDD